MAAIKREDLEAGRVDLSDVIDHAALAAPARQPGRGPAGGVPGAAKLSASRPRPRHRRAAQPGDWDYQRQAGGHG